MNKLNLLPGRATWLTLLVITLVGCAVSSAQETVTAPAATMTPATTQIPPPATYTPAPTVAPLPTSPPPTPTPTATATPTPLIPPCSFKAAPVSESSGLPLEAYVFSEPQVVLTHTSVIGIVDWLPDGKRLLITRLIPPAHFSEYVETFDVKTGTLQSYGERRNFYAKPVWLDSEQAVVFGDTVNGQWVLRISRGQESLIEDVVVGLASLSLAVSPDRQQIVFLPETPDSRPQILDVLQAQKRDLSFTLPPPPSPDSLTPPPISDGGQVPYKMVWRPDGRHIAFYNNWGFYSADMATGQLCEVNLGTPPVGFGKLWSVDAKWSPNGRYLAALTTVGEPIVPFIDLTLLDTSSGELRRLDLGHDYLYAIAWAPDSRVLLVLVEASRSDPTRTNQYDLYLVDAATGDSRQMLAGHTFMFSGVYGSAWSPTGQEIALTCPTVKPTDSTIAEGRLCLISVEAGP